MGGSIMLLEYLSQINDKRRGQGKKYRLEYIILFCILAILCNADGFPAIAKFIEVHLERLESIFGFFWVRSPDESTIRKILQDVDPKELEYAFRKYTQAIANPDKKTDLRCLAIDGKTLRGSFDKLKDQKSLHMLNVFATESNLIIANFETDKKSNEIPAVQELIREIGLDGCIFTMDAMHCQKKLLRL
jgi:hypothetical protein